jgi:hypothetical protein
MGRVETVNVRDPWSHTMPSVPRIVRALPHGPITRPEQGIPVVARLRWHHGVEQDVPATATAWTRDAVEISWEVSVGAGLRSDWIPADGVRRSMEEPTAPLDLPPHTRAGRSKPRW